MFFTYEQDQWKGLRFGSWVDSQRLDFEFVKKDRRELNERIERKHSVRK